VIGAPWQLIGAIHHLEANCSFATHLHNGDPLTRRTTHVPAGRPAAAPADGRVYTWEESALDALRSKGWDRIAAWPTDRMLYEAERYNGFGYVGKGVNSPYIWSGTSLYSRGKYVADGKYDASAVSQQVGVAAILRALEATEETKVVTAQTQTLSEFLLPLQALVPSLRAIVGNARYGSVVDLIIKDALTGAKIDVAGSVVEALQTVPSYGALVAVLKVAETAAAEIVAAPAVAEPQAAPVLAVEPVTKPEPTTIDKLFGETLTGWKTYLAIGLAVLVNAATALHFLPGILTPENVAAINVALAGLGGAGIISKIERYAGYLGMLRLR
jgi:lysozyme family protein